MSIVLIVCSMFGFYLKWFSFYTLLTVLCGLFGLFSLLVLLKLPWDLYFQAKDLLYDQEESLRKEIDVALEDQEYAKKAKYRLLFLCLFSHGFCAAIAAFISYQSKSQIGYYFALIFLISTIFRPLLAYYQKERERLFRLKEQCHIPREDSHDLKQRLKKVEHLFSQFEGEFENHVNETEKNTHNLNFLIRNLEVESKSFQKRNKEQYQNVLNQFGKSIEKLTEDQELLRGIRAMLRLMKEES